MRKPKVGTPTPLFEARIPFQIYDQMQRSARSRGATLKSYIVATAGADARQVVKVSDTMLLPPDDQRILAATLINPPQPNATLSLSSVVEPSNCHRAAVEVAH